jgi:hypothetical protein
MPRTYCALLLTDRAYDRVDLRLRETIARCMAHDPAQRPSLLQLLSEAKKGINRGFANESDMVIGKWIDDHIYSAPLVSNTYTILRGYRADNLVVNKISCWVKEITD